MSATRRPARSTVAVLLLLVLGLAGTVGAEEITIMLPGDVPMVLVRVPAGTFMMGSPPGERGNIFSNEAQHQVTLTKDYLLGKTEVTQAQWFAVTGQTIQEACATSGNVSNPLVGVGDNYPMYCANWDRIAGPGGFLEKLNEHLGTTRFRLPTEAEWERAARAGATTRFSHGDVLDCGDDCEACATHDTFMWWCGNNSPDGPKPVGQKLQNAFGLHDMHGNVFEVVNDRYADDYGNPSGGSVTDPTGPVTTGDVVFKGGGWDNEAWFARAAIRLGTAHGQQGQSETLGFRLAACAGPSITTQPLSTTIDAGQEATLSVTATANEGSLSYQWYFGESGDTSMRISANAGGTASSFTDSPSSTQSYWVRVSDGCASSDSATATITVEECFTPAVTSEPSNQTVFNGQSTTLSVGATGTSLNYQWYEGESGDVSKSVGTNSASYTTPALTQTTKYWVLVTGKCGNASSQTATVNVEPLEPCNPTSDSLCFFNNRFKVTLSAKNNNPPFQTGPGQSLIKTDLFGFFSIPALTSDPNNAEVFVKVIDGRAITGSFWVFWGGLTSFEYDMTVSDTVEGKIETYHKPGGWSVGGADTAAFSGGPYQAPPDTCSKDKAGVVPEMGTPVAPSTCTESAGGNNLCLLGGRFKVSITAVDPRTGDTGAGVSIPENELFGFFSIPDLTSNPDNPEVFVKILDGTSITGHNWVFYGALTDFEFTVRVEDTTTGAVYNYLRPKAGPDKDPPADYCGGFDTTHL